MRGAVCTGVGVAFGRAFGAGVYGSGAAPGGGFGSGAGVVVVPSADACGTTTSAATQVASRRSRRRPEGGR